MASTRPSAAARRDEERARAKERIFSHRDEFGQWGPEEPAPRAVEPLQTAASSSGEHFRVFPLSNWTELDIWQYIQLEEIELPSLYFARDPGGLREGQACSTRPAPFIEHLPGEDGLRRRMVRFRTIGDMTCTGAVRSRRRRPSRR